MLQVPSCLHVAVSAPTRTLPTSQVKVTEVSLPSDVSVMSAVVTRVLHLAESHHQNTREINRRQNDEL